MKVLTKHQERLLLQGITEPRDRAVMNLLLNTGLRVRELCELRWSSYIRANAQLSYLEVDGRRVPLNSIAMDALVEMGLERQGRTEAEHILKGLRGQPSINIRAVQQMVKKYAAEANLNDVTPMALRHTFSQRIATGQNANVIAQLTARHPVSVAQYQSKQQATLTDLAVAVKRLPP